MQIVIKIPDGYVKVVMANQRTEGTAMDKLLRQAVIDGTPLPKGHGDLKDMEDIYEALEGWQEDTGWIVDAIDEHTPTIIEADESEGEKWINFPEELKDVLEESENE